MIFSSVLFLKFCWLFFFGSNLRVRLYRESGAKIDTGSVGGLANSLKAQADRLPNSSKQRTIANITEGLVGFVFGTGLVISGGDVFSPHSSLTASVRSQLKALPMYAHAVYTLYTRGKNGSDICGERFETEGVKAGELRW